MYRQKVDYKLHHVKISINFGYKCIIFEHSDLLYNLLSSSSAVELAKGRIQINAVFLKGNINVTVYGFVRY